MVKDCVHTMISMGYKNIRAFCKITIVQWKFCIPFLCFMFIFYPMGKLFYACAVVKKW